MKIIININPVISTFEPEFNSYGGIFYTDKFEKC